MSLDDQVAELGVGNTTWKLSRVQKVVSDPLDVVRYYQVGSRHFGSPYFLGLQINKIMIRNILNQMCHLIQKLVEPGAGLGQVKNVIETEERQDQEDDLWGGGHQGGSRGRL